MTKSNQSSLDIADHLSRGEYDWCPEAETRLREQHDLIRQQQAELDRAVELYTDKAIENELLRKRFGEELDAHHSALKKISKLRKAREK